MDKKTKTALIRIVKDADKRLSKMENLVAKVAEALEKIDVAVEDFGEIANAIELLANPENEEDAISDSP